MPDLHGSQIKEEVAMSSPVVLITGALTGIGRATALASRVKERGSLFPVDTTMKVRS